MASADLGALKSQIFVPVFCGFVHAVTFWRSGAYPDLTGQRTTTDDTFRLSCHGDD